MTATVGDRPDGAPSETPRRLRGVAAALIGLSAASAVVAAIGRIPLLWDDPFPSGYDGWYYVLQVRSTQIGDPIFADPSWVYPPLALLGGALGDVITGNKVGALIFAALTAAAGPIAGWRWTGSLAAGAAMGAWWACSPLHLGISAEYLKNGAGVAVVAALLAALPGIERAWAPRVVTLLLLVLGFFVHKATAGLGALAVVSYLGAWAISEASARSLSLRRAAPPVFAAIAAGVLLLLGATWSVLRPQDFARLTGGGASRLTLFSGTLSDAEALEAAWIHLVPLLLVGALVLSRRPGPRPFTAAAAAVAILCAAPGLPFGWDLTAWRLILLGFLGAGALAGLAAARLGWPAAASIAAVGLLQLLPSARHQANREPDYPAWAEVVPRIAAAVPPGDRVVAHRGVCGFIWAEGGRVCENFQPPPPHDRWWRVVYGMGEERLRPYASYPVPLLPAYTLVREEEYQRFRADHVERFRLLSNDLNPWTERPGYVYGPGGGPETPP